MTARPQRPTTVSKTNGTWTPFERRLAGRLLDLAEKGRGLASPNPLVGAILVKGRRIIAEGYYRKFGGPHAEIMALKKAGARARGATLWSSLEPCTIAAKTPPCTGAIIAAGVKKVIYLAQDPNPRVRATAARQLRRGGVACEFRPLPQAAALNFGFARWIRSGRPFVTLKAAASLDGR